MLNNSLLSVAYFFVGKQAAAVRSMSKHSVYVLVDDLYWIEIWTGRFIFVKSSQHALDCPGAITHLLKSSI